MSQIDPLDALRRNFAEAVPHVKELGIRVTDFGTEGVTMALPYRDDWLGDTERGVIHTGIITTLVDSCCGLALLARLQTLEAIATLDLRMDYLRPALRDKEVHCRAECFRVTPHIAFLRATTWQDDPAEPLSVSIGAFMRTTKNKPRGNMIPA